MSTFVLNPAAMHRLFNSPQGPVAKGLAVRAVRVTNQAKINASGRPGPNVRTGRLRASITWQLLVDSLGLVARVGSNVHYAKYVEDLYPYLKPALAAARL